jgi:quinol monooxygenase YgiN
VGPENSSLTELFFFPEGASDDLAISRSLLQEFTCTYLQCASTYTTLSTRYRDDQVPQLLQQTSHHGCNEETCRIFSIYRQRDRRYRWKIVSNFAHIEHLTISYRTTAALVVGKPWCFRIGRQRKYSEAVTSSMLRQTNGHSYPH